ncbi:MAG: CDP-glycerol glycerophosphotransferase family protein [Spirochaetia bacterium]|nr:CDP-glycerol glycerophosphotransferase family protein [Spirochaetia bacterium]
MKKLIKSIIKKLPRCVITKLVKLKNCNYCYFFRLFPVQKNKIVVSNFFGNSYGDSPKYIVEKLLEKNVDCEIVWLLKKTLVQKALFPLNIKIVKYGSFRALYELATAKVWIDNVRKKTCPPKRKNQYYIQTWHSFLRLKKIEKDAREFLSETYVERAKIDSANCDLMISGCDFGHNIYRNSFWYDGEILKCGTPRCDIFFSDTARCKDRVYEYCGISSGTGLILYAPTYRSNSDVKAYLLDYEKIITALMSKFGGKWKILIRLHPKAASLSDQINYNENVFDVTDYDDMQELLAASDILITDYSSSMFDMIVAEKLCLIHAHDLKEYTAKERELYFTMEQLPFYVSRNTDELIKNIKNYDPEDYGLRLKQFSREVNIYEEGKASDRLAGIIREKISDKSI